MRIFRVGPRPLLALGALFFVPLVWAQAPSSSPNAAAYLAANCANCHGTTGVSASALPDLAGLTKSAFVGRMQEFRDGKRRATIMHQLAKGYSDQQIELMAEYFSRQTPGASKK